MNTLQDMLKLQRAADQLAAILDGPAPCISFAELIEAAALHAARKASESRIGSNDEESWTNASGHLFDLAQCGRLYRRAA